MATIIIKNSTGSSAVPSSLVQGELAINTVTGKLYYGSGSGNAVREFTGSATGGGSTFPYTGSAIITGSLTITGSTISTLGFTGSLFGTASWAQSASQAITSSYILSSNVYGPSGFDTINYAASAGTAGGLSSPINQNLQINGQFVTQLNNTNLNTFAQTVHSYTGNVVYGVIGDGINGSLIYLHTDNNWYPVEQTTDTSTKMLGICVDKDNNLVLLEGDIVLDQSSIDNPNYGKPVFISGSAGFTTRTDVFTSGYIRAVGHTYYSYTNISTNWILRFKPSNDWTKI